MPPLVAFSSPLSLSIAKWRRRENKPVVISIIVGLVKSLGAKAAYEAALNNQT